MVNKSRYSNGSKRRKLRARVRAEGRECGICHRPIDYSLPAGHPMSYELDEIVPFALGGSPYYYDNVQPAHRICNQQKGKKIGFKIEKGKPKKRKLAKVKNLLFVVRKR